MALPDDRILEYIYEEGSGSPQEMANNRIRFSRAHLSRRCKKLVDYGLLIHLGNGVYVIAEKGEQYIEGELGTAELEPREKKE